MKTLKILRYLFAATALGVVALTAWACSHYGPSPAGKGTAAFEEAPSIFNEAPVPEGWPALTPVDEIRVKQYPAYRAAYISADDDNSGSSGLFRPLFNHIKRQDIAMTAPVEMTYADDGEESSMAFLYRTTDMGALGSDTDDPDVVVKDIPAQTALSIGLKGGYSHSRFEKAVIKLNAWLNENSGYRAAGDPRYLGYNSPFVPGPMRYGEVQIPIEPAP